MAESLPQSQRQLCVAAAFASCLPMLFQVGPLLALVFVAVALAGYFSRRPLPAALRLLLVLVLAGLVLARHDFGIGRDSASAVLAAMLLMKTLETHGSRDARSLLGFSLFVPFAAFLQDQGPLVLLLSLASVAMVLLAMSVLVEAPPEPQLATPDPVTRLKRVAGMLALALPLALAGFWLFPRLSSPLWGLPGNAIEGGGLGDKMNPNDWLDTLADDRTAFRVRFIGAPPPRSAMYWRGPVLWDFDGEVWSREETDQFSNAPATTAAGERFRYELMLEPTERYYLPTLDLPTQAPENSRLSSELTAYRRRPVQSLISYGGESALQLQFEPLPESQRRRALRLPPGRNPRALAQARQWRAESASVEAYAERIMDWVRADFRYSITAPPLGRDAVDDFLFNTREGFCQHFSSSFVVMMRAAGVPARIVTGYAGGYRNRYGDYWSLYQRDAHAWAEIWLDGRGWVRMDPTAAVAPENILDTLSDLQADEGLLAAAGDGLTTLADVGDFLKRGWNDFVLGFNALRQQSLLRPIGIDKASQWQLLMALAAGAALALAATVLVLLRQHAGNRDPVERAWRKFCTRMARAGLPKQAGEPALSYVERLAIALPGQAAALHSLSARYVQRQYAARALDAATESELLRDLREFRPGHGASLAR